MTDLLARPLLKVKATPEGPRRPLALSGALAAAATVAVGLVVSIAICVCAWFAGSTGSFEAAVRVGVLAWLVGHGSGVVVGGLSLTAIPLGALACLGFALFRAGRWAATHSAIRSDRDLVAGVASLAAAYAAAAAVAATVAGTPQASTGPVRTAVSTLLVSLLAGGLGMVRGSGRLDAILQRLPLSGRAAARGAGAGWLAMVGAGALLVTASLVVQFSDVLRLTEGVAAGGLGGALLAALAVAALPNAVLCAGAYLAGPGFQLGTGTTVAPGDVRLGRLPAFPLLAVAPEDGAHGEWQIALVVVPVLAGALAGAVAHRRLRRAGALAESGGTLGWVTAAGLGGTAGLGGGVAFGLSTWLATGSVGPGRMQDVGPAVLATTGVCALAFALGGAAAAAGRAWWSSPSREPAAAGGANVEAPDSTAVSSTTGSGTEPPHGG